MRNKTISNQQFKAFLITLLESIKKSKDIKEVKKIIKNLIRTL